MDIGLQGRWFCRHSDENRNPVSFETSRSRATGEILFLGYARKSIQKEGCPAAASSFGLSAASGAAAELALSALKQSSPPAICRSSRRRGKGNENHMADYVN